MENKKPDVIQVEYDDKKKVIYVNKDCKNRNLSIYFTKDLILMI